MRLRFYLLTLFCLLLVPGCQKGSVGVNTAAIKPGMSAEEVRKALGEPFPGPSHKDLANGVQTDVWIYPSGDDAVFVTLQNGTVQQVNKKRVTMKDAAKKITTGMTEAQVKSLLGEPSGDGLPLDGQKRVTYLNEEAALDSLTVTYQNGQVTKIEVLPNSAVSGSR